MRFHKSNILLICSAAALLSACDIYESVPLFERIDKTPIELTVGGVDGGVQSRAVITTDPYNAHNYFDTQKATKVFMIMESKYGTTDYEGTKDPKYTVSRADVAANSDKLVFDDNNKKYWDDAHARSSELNIWAYAQKGMTWTECTFEKDKAGGGYEDEKFQTTNHFSWRTAPIYPFIREWKASHLTTDAQTMETVMCQDLLFSNNLVNNSATGYDLGGANTSLKFDFTNRKFPQEGEAVMKFYHAMAKMTINIVEGDGFNAGSTEDFKFKAGTNISFPAGQFNTKGLFSIRQGIFQEISERNVVPTISCPTIKADGTGYTLEALAIPNVHEFLKAHSGEDKGSRFVAGAKDLTTDVMMEFTIDNNKYQITSGQLYDALHVDGNPANALVDNATEKTDNGTYIPLEAGKNYIFTFVVGKTRIKNLTASVADWENVTADELNPSNARIKLLLEERGSEQTSGVSFYRAADDYTGADIKDNYTTYNWHTGYTIMPAKYSTDHWESDPSIYWTNSKNFLHFRALMPTGQTLTTTDDDYVPLTSASSYTDVCWGAPMLDVADNTTSDASTLKWLYGPTTNGFDAKDDGTVANGLPTGTQHQIYGAIGPTEDAVKLILFHMMSDLTFNITTTTGDDKVTLDDGTKKTKVEIVGFHPGGQVLLGNGLVKTTSATGDASIDWNSLSTSGAHVYKYGVVPQDLTSVKLRITTPDNNQYIVDLKEVKATNVETYNLANPYTKSDGAYKITRWYPGFKYVYSIKLKKTGIDNLTATIVDWETITADDETVVIK